MHPIFHVSALKPYFADLEDPSRNKSKRPHVKIRFNMSQAVEDILAERSVTDLATGIEHKEYLVKWRDRGDEDNSWETEEDLIPLSERKSAKARETSSSRVKLQHTLPRTSIV